MKKTIALFMVLLMGMLFVTGCNDLSYEGKNDKLPYTESVSVKNIR